MKRTLLSVLVVAALFTVAGTPAGAGVEPSPFFTSAMTTIKTQLVVIGSRISDTETQLALDRIGTQVATYLDTRFLNEWLSEEMADQGGRIMVRLSDVLFDPQPEPPGHVAVGLDVLNRISWALFDPQPEPPGLSADLYAPAIRVMYNVAGVMERVVAGEFQDGPVPGLNALERLSGHLVVAVVDKRRGRAAAQVNAMFRIAEQYAGR